LTESILLAKLCRQIGESAEAMREVRSAQPVAGISAAHR
jgi:hypothetical protein